MDNCGTSRKYLSGKVGSPSSFDLTIGIALLIVILVNNAETSYATSFCPRGTSRSAILLMKSSLLMMVIVETYKRSYYLGKELGSIIHHTANA